MRLSFYLLTYNKFWMSVRRCHLWLSSVILYAENPCGAHENPCTTVPGSECHFHFPVASPGRYTCECIPGSAGDACRGQPFTLIQCFSNKRAHGCEMSYTALTVVDLHWLCQIVTGAVRTRYAQDDFSEEKRFLTIFIIYWTRFWLTAYYVKL